MKMKEFILMEDPNTFIPIDKSNFKAEIHASAMMSNIYYPYQSWMFNRTREKLTSFCTKGSWVVFPRVVRDHSCVGWDWVWYRNSQGTCWCICIVYKIIGKQTRHWYRETNILYTEFQKFFGAQLIQKRSFWQIHFGYYVSINWESWVSQNWWEWKALSIEEKPENWSQTMQYRDRVLHNDVEIAKN